MTLENLSLGERRKITRAWPVLISSFPNAGKSYSLEQLPEEELARTIYINTENKVLPNLFGDELRTIIMLKPEGLIPPEKSHLYKDYDNVKFKTLSELQLYIRKALAHKDVDRIVLDSFTALVDALESHYVSIHNGFTVWAAYNNAIHEWLALIKEETMMQAKFFYVLGHYVPSKDPKDTDSEKFTKVSGNKWHRLIEASFNNVLTIDDHKFVADNDNLYDSTRIHASLSPYESKHNSMAELEEALGNLYTKKDKKESK